MKPIGIDTIEKADTYYVDTMIKVRKEASKASDILTQAIEALQLNIDPEAVMQYSDGFADNAAEDAALQLLSGMLEEGKESPDAMRDKVVEDIGMMMSFSLVRGVLVGYMLRNFHDNNNSLGGRMAARRPRKGR